MTTGPPTAGTTRVLIVEDDAAFRIPLRAALVAAGYSVIAVDSGRAAETVLERETVTVVLSDLGLPDIDGATLAAQHPTVPFVIMTGSPADKVPEATLPPSVLARLIKPFDVTQLTVVLDAAAARRGSTEPAPRHRAVNL